jgi:hypothetical protein
MTSIYAYRTVKTPTIMPPREDRPAPAPRLSMAEDAKLCNSLGTWRRQNWHTTKNDRGERPPAKKRYVPDFAARDAALIDAMPGTVRELAERTGLTISIVCKALPGLRANGKASTRKAGRNALIWSAR